MKRCAWCGELRDRLALPDGELRDRLALPDGEHVCRCCVSYAAHRACWYGDGEALPVGLIVTDPATEAAPVPAATAGETTRRAAA